MFPEKNSDDVSMLDNDELQIKTEGETMQRCQVPAVPDSRNASRCSRVRILAFVGSFVLLGCIELILGRPGRDSDDVGRSEQERQDGCAKWAAVSTAIAESEACNVSFVAGDEAHGAMVLVRKGPAAPSLHKHTWIASATKWVTAAILLNLVEQEILSLDDRPSKYLPFWSTSAADNRSAVTLHHLLSFTSGMVFHDGCASDPNNMTSCAKHIFELGSEHLAGAALYYSNSHLTVASAMAETATGQTLQELLDVMAGRLGFTDAPYYGLGGAAGGLRISASDYARFLQALLKRPPAAWFQSTETIQWAFADHTQGAAQLRDLSAFGLPAWHYSHGHWVGCVAGEWQPACADPASPDSLHNSMGALGCYPVIRAPLGTAPHQHFSIVVPHTGTLEEVMASDLSDAMALSYKLSTAAEGAVLRALSAEEEDADAGICTVVQNTC